MFYSHEVLTSRKYGVATVWLVATLGSKSSLKRINRKQILDVDVAKACKTIVDPVAPMALRLQGNLLYGVSRVYLQQCGYVLSDAQNACNSLRTMLRTVENLVLDPNAGKARPEQLILPDDPSFLPDFLLSPPELLAELDQGFNVGTSRSADSQSLTPFGSQREHSFSSVSALGGLVIPSSSSPGRAGSFILGDDNEVGGSNDLINLQDDIQLGEPGFTFDENGELVDGLEARIVAGTPAGHSGTVVHSDAGASERVWREHEEGRLGALQIPGNPLDLDLPIFGEDLPEGEAFPTVSQNQNNEQAEVVHSSSTTSAPMRKKTRAPRVLPTDTTMELKNKDLADWNANYLQNMNQAVRLKKQSRSTHQAKKDAKYFLWDSGIGGIAQQFSGATIPNPFDMFVGDNFFELLTGMSRKKTTSSKHDRDSGIDDATQEESRRVRQRTGEPEDQMGRGGDDEGFFMPNIDEVELPREAVTALDDQQIFSAMPWNISASKHGSSAVPRSAQLDTVNQSRPGSRFVSASPLHGRGQPLGLEVFKSLESDGDVFARDDFVMPVGPSSPPTMVGAPLQPSFRVREALSAEGVNFLDFVREAMGEKRNRAQVHPNAMPGYLKLEAVSDINEITFEEILPPSMNNSMIACQGLMMVLALGTNGMLDVQQPDDFGDIRMRLSEKAKAGQVIEISDSEESEDEESDVDIVDEMMGEGQGDDHDSLYDD
ncbi:Rec8 like protein-domain-containing protein [Phaeosphaeriaceae sp. PMI808]|nr:Rec8 like protein-domain-containing protein [Phaeosphaeriaceae sp. PMI808]